MVRLTGLAVLALAAVILSLLVGGTAIAPQDLLGALFHPHTQSDVVTILWQLRLPRICVAAVVGAELAVGGVLLQGILRNPLVDPYLTGVSAGAAAAIVLAIVLGVAAPFIPSIGFVAGLATSALVAALARRGAGLDPTRLILAGVSLSAVFSAIVTLVIAREQSTDYAAQIILWLAGSMAGRSWHDLVLALPYVTLGLILAIMAIPALNALRIGEVRAASAGVDVQRSQWLILAAASLFAASAVALAGIIGFIGLIVPHLARRIVGGDARMLLPASIFIGAGFCALADAVSRALSPPVELPISALLAFVGVPTFLYLYLHRERQHVA